MLNIMQYPITAKFGQVDSVHKQPHSGLDLATPVGTPVQSPENNALVEKIIITPETGLSVFLQLDGGRKISFSHLSKAVVKEGQSIKKGDVVALSGNTGTLTTGPHVHVTLRHNEKVVDPLPYLDGEISNGLSLSAILIIFVLCFMVWRLRKYVLYSMLAGVAFLFVLLIGILD